jgi:RNA 2',3'-cyclic 3'-phosphodiesterase
MRLFVAIVPPPAVLAELGRQLSPVQAASAPGLRWTSPDSWHITLAFLGEVPGPVLPELSTRLERAAREHPAADLRLRGGGAFPWAVRARAVTAVVTGTRGARPAEVRPRAAEVRPRPAEVRPRPAEVRPLDALAAAVGHAARAAGVPPPADDPPYRAHLTVARLRPAADVSSLLARLAALDVGPWRTADIRLIRSYPGGSPPGPPRYAELDRWPLGERPA